MRNTKSNYKKAVQRAKLYHRWWLQALEEKDELIRKHNEAQLQCLKERVDFLREAADNMMHRIDVEIYCNRINSEVLSKESLEVRFKHSDYRSN